MHRQLCGSYLGIGDNFWQYYSMWVTLDDIFAPVQIPTMLFFSFFFRVLVNAFTGVCFWKYQSWQNTCYSEQHTLIFGCNLCEESSKSKWWPSSFAVDYRIPTFVPTSLSLPFSLHKLCKTIKLRIIMNEKFSKYLKAIKKLLVECDTLL